ncbi:MAG TPA: hypothetical protein PKV72_00855 [Candidatus Peribacteria bacterium]|nr:hypothetical protein [Candidatus Peribacteria bacterium]
METSVAEPPSRGAEKMDPAEIRKLQLEASRLQLNISTLSADEHARYEAVMRTLAEQGADDWGD